MLEIIIVIIVITCFILYAIMRLIHNVPKSIQIFRERYYNRRKDGDILHITKEQKKVLINTIFPLKFRVSKEINGTYYFKNAIITLNYNTNNYSEFDDFISTVHIMGPSNQMVQMIKKKIMDELNIWEIENSLFYDTDQYHYDTDQY
ncbi:MAG: hypothetical protein ACTSPY_02565 [Candidatus Helarchaeota archaeon]